MQCAKEKTKASLTYLIISRALNAKSSKNCVEYCSGLYNRNADTNEWKMRLSVTSERKFEHDSWLHFYFFEERTRKGARQSVSN